MSKFHFLKDQQGSSQHHTTSQRGGLPIRGQTRGRGRPRSRPYH